MESGGLFHAGPQGDRVFGIRLRRGQRDTGQHVWQAAGALKKLEDDPMPTKSYIAVPVVSLLLAATPVAAHSAFAAEFDVNQPVKVKGTLTKVEWVNPHAWIYVDVKGADGKGPNWNLEVGPP